MSAEKQPDEIVEAVRQRLASTRASLSSVLLQIDTGLDKLVRAHESKKHSLAKIAELEVWLAENDPPKNSDGPRGTRPVQRIEGRSD